MPEGKTFDPIKVLHSLPVPAQKEIKAILTRGTDIEETKQLKAVLHRYAKELEKFGLIPDYFAYALIYVWPHYARQTMNRPERPHSAHDYFGPN